MLNFDNNKSQSYKTKICHINIINYLSFQIRWYVSTVFPGLKYDLNYLLQFKHNLGQSYSYRIDSWSDLMYPITLLINFLSTNNLFICLSSFHHFFHLFNNFLRVWHLKHDSSSLMQFVHLEYNTVLRMIKTSRSLKITQFKCFLVNLPIRSQGCQFKNIRIDPIMLNNKKIKNLKKSYNFRYFTNSKNVFTLFSFNQASKL